MKIEDFFDPTNIEHLKALKHIEDNGVWPQGFLPDDLEFSPSGMLIIYAKVAQQHIKEKLG